MTGRAHKKMGKKVTITRGRPRNGRPKIPSGRVSSEQERKGKGIIRQEG